MLISGELGTGMKSPPNCLHPPATRADSPLVRIDCRLSSMESFREGLLGANGIGRHLGPASQGRHAFPPASPVLAQETQQAELVSVLRNNAHDFRLICATEEDLEKLSEQGQFNEELFYRVAVAAGAAARRCASGCEDIPLLLKDIAAETPSIRTSMPGRSSLPTMPWRTLQAYRWPGNLAEFTQMISQIVTHAETRVITSAQLPLRVHELKTGRRWPIISAGQEKQYIARVLHACRGRQGPTAAKVALGVDGQLAAGSVEQVRLAGGR